LKEINGSTVQYFFVSYKWLDGKEHNPDEFITNRHGNAASSHCSEYIRADKSLKKSAQEKLKSMSPSACYHQLTKESKVFFN